MESTKFMEDNENKQRTVLVKQRRFNDATFCKTADMTSKASIETSKLVLFCLWKSPIEKYDRKKKYTGVIADKCYAYDRCQYVDKSKTKGYHKLVGSKES